jgi:RNA polymerase subunit RPABC4/transcription elongation factor Spt4
MATNSIYHKACPSCAALVEMDVKRCGCGFAFEAQAQDDIMLAEDQAVQDEELLREYLHARIGQAVSELETFQAAMAHDVHNLDKANRLFKAFSHVRQLRAELDTQTAKIAETKKAARAARAARGMTVEADHETPTTSAEPTEAFRAVQSEKAENAMKAAGIETKACPACHTVLPQPAVLCFCGYNFTQRRSGLPNRKPAASPLEHRKAI